MMFVFVAPKGLVEIEQGPFAGHRWAQPSGQHLRELMRRVMTNREEAMERGLRGRKTMVEEYCPSCVASIVKERLLSIAAGRGDHEKRYKSTTSGSGMQKKEL